MTNEEREKKIEAELLKVGYNRSPNNWNVWSAGGPGIPAPEVSETNIYIFVTNGHIEFRHFWTGAFIDSFESVEELLTHCREHGWVSLPGAPSFSNSWD